MIIKDIKNKEKYKALILYLCSKLKGVLHGKKKLAKLLYYVDFDYFEKFGTSITADTYKALPMGPFPVNLTNILSEMKSEKSLKVKTVQQYSIPTEVYECLKNSNLDLFSSEEKEMIDRVLIKYGHLSGGQLENLSHAEAPYVGTPPNKEIIYELAYYRGTDFSC